MYKNKQNIFNNLDFAFYIPPPPDEIESHVDYHKERLHNNMSNISPSNTNNKTISPKSKTPSKNIVIFMNY